MAKKVNIRELSYPELLAKRNETKKEYFDLRIKSVMEHLDNPVQLRIIRRKIAALNTVIREKEIAGESK